MAGNFEGIKTRNFGIEIEMTGLTRCQAAKAIAKVLGGTAFHEGGSYDKYIVMSKAERGQLFTTAVSNVWMQMATVRRNHTA